VTQGEENHRREPSWPAADSCDFYRIRTRHEVRRTSLSINGRLILGVPATSSWRAARLEPPARIRFNFFLKIEVKEWRKKIGIAELIPFSTLSRLRSRVMAHVIWLRDRKYRSDALRPNVGRFRSSARKTLWPAPFYRECNEDSPKRLSARVRGAIFSKLLGAPGRFQRQSKGIKTHTRYEICYRSQESAFGKKERNPRKANK